MLVFFTLLLLLTLWGVLKPFGGLTRKQFGLSALGVFVLCLIVAPSPDTAPTGASGKDAIADFSSPAAPPSENLQMKPAAIDQSVPEEPQLTGPQRNAVRSAEQYLAMSGFSRTGLIKQLSSDAGEGYAEADAIAAVDSLDVDWNSNAARSARQYLDMSGFSCKGLIEQLSSSAGEGYTEKQATYGAQQAGAC